MTTPDAPSTPADDDLRQRFIEALDRSTTVPSATRPGLYDVMLAAVQPELERLRAQVAHQGAYITALGDQLAELERDRDRYAAALDRPAAPDEKPQPCDQSDPCADGGLCNVHEEERAHAEGDHSVCGVTCEVEFTAEKLRNAILYRAIPGSTTMLDELLRRAALAGSAEPAEEPQDDDGGEAEQRPFATDAELAIRQRYAWRAAGCCPRCGSSGTDGWFCASCGAEVRKMRAGERRIWRRWEQPFRGAPIQGSGYSPAQLIGGLAPEAAPAEEPQL